MIIHLPSLPNAPLKSRVSNQRLAPVKLRYSKTLHFLENEAFNPTLIDYSQDYENSQAHSLKFVSHMKNVLEILKTQLPKESLIVEVGCGKGDFVELIQNDGYFNVKGFDASYDGENKAIEKRYLSDCDKVSADIVVIRHVLEHISNPYSFLKMLHSVFGTAKVYIEVPSYDWIIDNQTYFDITYEHVNYFSQVTLESFFRKGHAKHGLLFEDQYQYVLSDFASLDLEFEKKYSNGLWEYPTFDSLFPNITETIDGIKNSINNKRLFVWGGGTKGCLFLAHCMLHGKLIDQIPFVVDINPKKIGKFLPGSLVEIRSKYDFFNEVKSGDVVLVVNPAYKDEIEAEIKMAHVSNVIIETL